MTVAALIVAAGRGSRAGGAEPKQWQRVAGKPVIDHTLERFTQHPRIDRIMVVLHQDDMDLLKSTDCEVTQGGASRDASVRNGLDALTANPPDQVLIHDVARPALGDDVIERVLDALKDYPAAAPGLPVTDALWRGANGTVTGGCSREGLYRAQTPQGFHFDAILKAHHANNAPAADDVEVARRAGLEVAIVDGDERNLKITRSEDFARAALALKGSHMTDIRLGNGYDVHAFEPGNEVILCGVPVTHTAQLKGHSDADVAMHAITDALYGAIAEGDIGRHFPPSDPQWKDAASAVFLSHAAELVRARGFEISNIDCTIVCELPKIGPHAAAMQANLAKIIDIEQTRISVKATTSERLGFTGRQEGIAAIATAALQTS
ncbi:MAG: bifunctional 2-C-methyl-D-erythritol 4-phosphate cytidylyltransferase/2-C-methyl-D-erythritol 2,4-cyclodiphosphate synthase [Rhodobacteraceae bacterium]|nr:bifunctional 2-C-methyl-D-erythritol 4-phosphate cytidylyltransferase/2-C-methyl-D-erythritol 2,4-cyclodiphosphate synthase [Paracoccaceae bacterium]RZO40927.1 MAG: bifunctional 2-C-methyl-D-erythritol 4-phosphate cytidylyltransferase/2-C-methyl-D-erythritol 2,4-cyclodiphosphate synthase [Paracoccaceae bacterium]